MGMSTHVVAIRPPDERWIEMKKVWDSCEKAGVDVPDKVMSFFNHEAPDETGVLIDIERGPAVSVFEDDCKNGFEVDLATLPPDVKKLRFWNSY